MSVTASSSRRGRWVVLSLLCVTIIGVIAWAYSYGPDYIRVRVYAERIRKGINPQGNLEAMARVNHPETVRVLEKYAARPTPAMRKSRALILLCRYFPESRMPRGVRDYEAITGKRYGYFSHYYKALSTPIRRDQASAFRGWLARYPKHPGRDDALFRMGVEVQKSSPRKALELLYRGFHEPDGDKKHLIAKYFQRVLERYASVDDILALYQGSVGESVGDNLLYVAGIKKMRAFQFDVALELFMRSVKARGASAPEMLGRFSSLADPRPSVVWRPRNEAERKLKVLRDIDQQIKACRWFLEKMNAHARASEDEGRAKILHEVARRCFKEPDLFVNHMYYEYPLDERVSRRGQIVLEDVHESNHYRQAAMVFRRIARDYPSYSHLDEVEYSIPLCAWRLRRAWGVRIGGRINEEIWRGFQAFAEKHPASSMADDALYIAGIHHRLLNGPKDTSRMRENAEKIARDYPDGDILVSEAKRNFFLKQALAEHELAGE